MWGEGTVLDVDVGPNLYAYVRQNPWSKFDPTGLGEEDVGPVTGFLNQILSGQPASNPVEAVKNHLVYEFYHQRYKPLKESTWGEIREGLSTEIGGFFTDPYPGNPASGAVKTTTKLASLTPEVTDTAKGTLISVKQALEATTQTTKAATKNAMMVAGPGGKMVDLKKFNFGAHLTKMIGPAPKGMKNPHAHHILFKVGLGKKQKAIASEGQAILRKYGIDPLFGKEVLTWAPNKIKGQHSIDALTKVVDKIKEVDNLGLGKSEGREIMTDALKELGKRAAQRK